MTTVRVLGVATLIALPGLVFKMSRKQKVRAATFGPVLEHPGEPSTLPLPKGEGRGEGEQGAQFSMPDCATKPTGGAS